MDVFWAKEIGFKTKFGTYIDDELLNKVGNGVWLIDGMGGMMHRIVQNFRRWVVCF